MTSPTIASAYRAGRLADFFEDHPARPPETRAFSRPDVDRPALVAALRAYHADLGTLDEHVESALARLAHPASRVVVTGQQAGVLTGPAYSVHKGMGAVLLANELDAEDAPTVAVYWVASQDHDAAEVAATTLLDMDETLHHVRLDLPNGRPIAKVEWESRWTRETRRVLSAFQAPEPHKAWVTDLVERSVERGGSVADVFARLVHRLLGPRGLLVLDPMHPALARLFAPTLERELSAPLESSKRIERAAANLQRLGFTPQLRRPEGATNLFLEGDDGARRLLRFDGRAFHADRAYDAAALIDLLHADPTRLTPAAGLRPIVQDAVLPTAAFVVGPGEIAYGAQLRDVYPLHGLKQPLLWPRLSVTWLEPPVARILTRFGLAAADFQRDPDGALGLALAKARGADATTSARLDDLRASFAALTRDIADLDPVLEGAVKRTEARTLERLERLQRLARLALVHRLEERTGQAYRLRKHLLPNGVPQEREMNFLTYLLKHGAAPLDRLAALPPDFQGELPL